MSIVLLFIFLYWFGRDSHQRAIKSEVLFLLFWILEARWNLLERGKQAVFMWESFFLPVNAVNSFLFLDISDVVFGGLKSLDIFFKAMISGAIVVTEPKLARPVWQIVWVAKPSPGAFFFTHYLTKSFVLPWKKVREKRCLWKVGSLHHNR